MFDPHEVDEVFGPPATNSYNRRTDMECRLCDVWWHSEDGRNCWVCGRWGRPMYHGVLMNGSRFVDQPPAHMWRELGYVPEEVPDATDS